MELIGEYAVAEKLRNLPDNAYTLENVAKRCGIHKDLAKQYLEKLDGKAVDTLKHGNDTLYRYKPNSSFEKQLDSLKKTKAEKKKRKGKSD